MRLAPVPMVFAAHPPEAIKRSGESSRTTHQAQTAIDACRYFGGLLVGALRRVDKDTLLFDHYAPVAGYWQANPLHPGVKAVAEGSFKENDPPAIRGSGYVVASLEAALWAFYRSDSFEEGCLKAVNLGDDADTTGAVYGQIAGAYYGAQGVPEAWLERLAYRERIEGFADALLELSLRRERAGQ